MFPCAYHLHAAIWRYVSPRVAFRQHPRAAAPKMATRANLRNIVPDSLLGNLIEAQSLAPQPANHFERALRQHDGIQPVKLVCMSRSQRRTTAQTSSLNVAVFGGPGRALCFSDLERQYSEDAFAGFQWSG